MTAARLWPTVGLDPGVHPCVLGTRHQPRLARTVQHHLLPESWGGLTVPGNLIDVCDNHHYAVHTVIDEYTSLTRVLYKPGQWDGTWIAPMPTWLGRFDAATIGAAQRALAAVAKLGTVPGQTL